VFALASQRPESTVLFEQAARSWMCRKATSDPHEYKFLAAMLEEGHWVSRPWQPHMLAASVHFLHGEQSVDHPVVVQASEALETRG
jgi:hypothetical protein